MKRGGLDFVILKATQGAGMIDPTFHERRARALSVGLRVGAYHFVDPKVTAAANASNFLKALGALRSGELPPVIDIEEIKGWAAMLRPAREAYALEILKRVEQVTGRVPMVYTSLGWWRGWFRADFSRFPLWLAKYPKTLPNLDALPALDVEPWKRWTCWQYTDKGTAPGVDVPVDLNVWNGPLPK